MSGKEGVPEFSRQELRKATKFVEGDYSGINPRSFYRKLKRSLEEIQDSQGFKYQCGGDQGTDLDISSEDVGEKTGVVKGRLLAKSDWLEIGEGQLEYRPYGPHGAASIVAGIACLVIGLSNPGNAWTILGLLLAIAGGYGYFQMETDEFPIIRRDLIRTLITGEVSERTTEAGTEKRTDIFANMSVVFAGDIFVAVDTSRLDELNWTFRRNLVNQVRRWRNEIVHTEQEELPVEDGFIWELSGWTDRSVREHRTGIKKAQRLLLNDDTFEYRFGYTNLLKEQLPPNMQSTLKTHEQELMEELESLSRDVDVYVEREGLEHTGRTEAKNPDHTPSLDTDEM